MFRGIACFDECHPEKIFTYLAKAVWLFFANQDSESLVRPCWFFGLDSFSQLGDSYLAEWSCSIVITWFSHLIDLGCFFHVKPGCAWDISGYFWFIIHLLLLEGRSFFYIVLLQDPPFSTKSLCRQGFLHATKQLVAKRRFSEVQRRELSTKTLCRLWFSQRKIVVP